MIVSVLESGTSASGVVTACAGAARVMERRTAPSGNVQSTERFFVIRMVFPSSDPLPREREQSTQLLA
ncbi:hypothetical protein ASG04_10480 [Curtobacterium sp. Leaf183]|nr:hypothetical protein ASG04_10480 [Curtobacterium sp. Leaf183]